MTDRELLDAAAKASGIIATAYYGPSDEFYGLVIDATGDEWNPLTDDGDALRLAVQLHMRVSIGQVDWVGRDYIGEFSSVEEVDADPYAATRRAIVRAAAEIAKTKGG